MNCIDVNTLGKMISVRPGEPICKPADFTSRPMRFVMVLYGIATLILKKEFCFVKQKYSIQTFICIESAHTWY